MFSNTLPIIGGIAHASKFLRKTASDETFDVGVDTRTGVDDKDYQVPFAFTGTIDKLRVQLS